MGNWQKKSWILAFAFVLAVAAGYWVSAVIGTEFLRLEVEKQLSGHLRGPVKIAQVRLALRDGLILEGEQLGVYPSREFPHGPRLFSKFARAKIDLLALVAGRLRLTELLLRDATFEIRRVSEQDWEPFPVQALFERREASVSPGLEGNLNLFKAFEGVARVLLSGPIAADHFSVENGLVIFRDETLAVHGPKEIPRVLNLHGLQGQLVHHWLSGEAQLILSGEIEENGNRRTPIVARGRHDGAGSMQLDFEFANLPLDIIAPYLFDPTDPTELAGSLSGQINYQTDSPQTGELGLHWTVENFRLADDTKNGPFAISQENSELHALLVLSPTLIHLSNAELHSDGVTTQWRGQISRPLGASANAHAEADFIGLDLAEIRQLSNSLPEKTSHIFQELLVNVKQGQIEEIGLIAEMELSDWGRLFAGKMENLPPELVVEATLSEIDTVVNQESLLSGVGGRIRLTGNSLSVQRTEGLWNGEELPTLELRIDGVSNFLRAVRDGAPIVAEAPGLAGVDALLEILAGDASEGPEGENRPLRIWLDYLLHPALGWPVYDGILSLSTDESRTQLRVEEAIWAGAPIRGNLVWTTEPNKRLEIYLRAEPPVKKPSAGTKAPVTADPEAAVSEVQAEVGHWASGRFESDRVDGLLLPLIGLEGKFDLEGSSLALSALNSDLEPRGSLLARLSLNLEHADRVPIECKFTIQAADIDRATQALGFDAGTITGVLELRGEMAGEMRPNVPFFTTMTGVVDLESGRGALRRDDLPLLLALVQASAGYNEYAQRTEIVYDSMKARITVEEGSVQTRNFELDGPLRIYASGTLGILGPPNELVGVVGIFLFRNAGELMASIPLVKTFLPGSKRGLVGAYYQVSGNLERPKVSALAGRSVAEGLPAVLEAPYQILRAILSGGNIEEGRTTPAEKKKPKVEVVPQRAPEPAKTVPPPSGPGDLETQTKAAP